ncbi:uncharacterized protein LOC62_02G003301 [Vanrija pseudolonga]|uniref:Uncharacterized protein n=1 Tax=Vanrija pseudolonga TaxID=143232 RepID=A0AAF1BJF0_9TREE|nr:hypothetical protein LOC62_02G003301 [Vanrija pseudolonga]
MLRLSMTASEVVQAVLDRPAPAARTATEYEAFHALQEACRHLQAAKEAEDDARAAKDLAAFDERFRWTRFTSLTSVYDPANDDHVERYERVKAAWEAAPHEKIDTANAWLEAWEASYNATEEVNRLYRAWMELHHGEEHYAFEETDEEGGIAERADWRGYGSAPEDLYSARR